MIKLKDTSIPFWCDGHVGNTNGFEIVAGRATRWLGRIATRESELVRTVETRVNRTVRLGSKSRLKPEFQVRFRESAGVRSPRATRLGVKL